MNLKINTDEGGGGSQPADGPARPTHRRHRLRAALIATPIAVTAVAVVNLHPSLLGLSSERASANPLQMTAGLPFQDPPAAAYSDTVDPTVPGGVVRTFSLRSSNAGAATGLQGTVPIGGLDTGAVKVFNASNTAPAYTGPTLRIRRGSRTVINFTNDMSETTIMHFHGSHLSPGFVTDALSNPDGQQDDVFVTVNPGETRKLVLDVPMNQPLGTIWYHTHMHDTFFGLPGVVSTDSQFPVSNLPAKPESSQLFKGFAGLIEVDDTDGTPLQRSIPNAVAKVLNAPERSLEIKEFQLASAPGTAAGAQLVDPADSSYLPGAPNCTAPKLIPGTNCITRTVNGQYQPVISMTAGRTELWHVANTSPNGWFDLTATGGTAGFYIVGQDGNTAWNVVKANHLALPPGRRFDVLVTGTDNGTFKLQTAAVSMGSQARWATGKAGSGYVGDQFQADTLATIKVAGSDGSKPAMPTSVVPATHLTTVDGAKRTMIFDESFDPSQESAFRVRAPQMSCDANNANCTVVTTPGGWPAAGDPLMIPLSELLSPGSTPPTDSWTGLPEYFPDNYPGSPGPVKLGTTEEWTLYNYTPENHPFHIHTNTFELVAVNGVPVTANSMSDTEVIPHATYSTTKANTMLKPGSITIRMKFQDFAGDVMFHCHISEHLDNGMISFIHVAP
jgi:FtsP/CotA-like multicopper oxidase with cupredoxin domain